MLFIRGVVGRLDGARGLLRTLALHRQPTLGVGTHLVERRLVRPANVLTVGSGLTKMQTSAKRRATAVLWPERLARARSLVIKVRNLCP
jgi:hypothetical protein